MLPLIVFLLANVLGSLKYLLEISFKCRDTSPGHIRKPLNTNIKFIIAIHEGFNIYFFGYTKIK
jgi:hypothetical protein